MSMMSMKQLLKVFT